MKTNYSMYGLTEKQHRLFLLKQHMFEQEDAAEMENLLAQ